jgi:hypothetical protein
MVGSKIMNSAKDSSVNNAQGSLPDIRTSYNIIHIYSSGSVDISHSIAFRYLTSKESLMKSHITSSFDDRGW